MLDYIGSVDLTEVVMNIPIFWDITPRIPLKVNLRFREKRSLHAYLLHATPLLCLFMDFKMEAAYSL
jgi:hypothetical protein